MSELENQMQIDGDAKDNEHNLVNNQQESHLMQFDDPGETFRNEPQESLLQKSSVVEEKQQGRGDDTTGFGRDVTNLYPTIVNFFTFQLRKLAYILAKIEGTETDIENVMTVIKKFKVALFLSNAAPAQNLLDVYYANNINQYRNRIDVCAALKLSTSTKNVKVMSKKAVFQVSAEWREKFEISQQLLLNNGKCEGIYYHNDNLIVYDTISSSNSYCNFTSDIRTSDLHVDSDGKISNGSNIDVSSSSSSSSSSLATTTAKITPTSTSRPLITDADADRPYDKTFGAISAKAALDVGLAFFSVPKEIPDYYIPFVFGNITILDWGKVIKNVMFHNKTQIFPLGFKSVRHELDTEANRLIDIFIEVDAIVTLPTTAGIGGGTSFEKVTWSSLENPYEVLPQLEHQGLITKPLFRITVAWQKKEELQSLSSSKPDENIVTMRRVYEAESAQGVAQAVMSDKLRVLDKDFQLTQKGKDELVTENGVIIPTATPTPSTTSVNDTATAAADTALARVLDVECMEMPDIEERQLRNQVMELRDRYYNILQSESANGINDSSQSMPNLPVNLLESLLDSDGHMIMRMIEGMEGTESCMSYEYLDTRLQVGRRVGLSKDILGNQKKMQIMQKHFERQVGWMVNRKGSTWGRKRKALKSGTGNSSASSSSKTTGGRGGSGGTGDGGPLKKAKLPIIQMPGPDYSAYAPVNDAQSIYANSETPSSHLQLYSNHNNYSNTSGNRDFELERVLGNISNIMRRQAYRQRHNIGALIDKHWEEERTTYMSGANRNANKASSISSTDEKIDCMDTTKHDQYIDSSFPEPSCSICSPGDNMGGVIELWTFLVTFADGLGIHTLPSLTSLVEAFEACDPFLNSIYRKLQTIRSSGPINSDVSHPRTLPLPRVKSQSRYTDSMGSDWVIDYDADGNILSTRHVNEFKNVNGSKFTSNGVSSTPNGFTDTNNEPYLTFKERHVSNLFAIAPDKAHTMLEKVGMLLTKALRDEYCKLIGINEVDAKLFKLKIDVNILNWREIARCVLQHNANKELQMTDADSLAMFKGKQVLGHTDENELRMIRLVRERILFTGYNRRKMREEHAGFQSGFVVRLRTPGIVGVGAATSSKSSDGNVDYLSNGLPVLPLRNLHSKGLLKAPLPPTIPASATSNSKSSDITTADMSNMTNLRWQYLLSCLAYIPNESGWLARKLICTAIGNLAFVSNDMSDNNNSHIIIQALQMALRPPIFHPENIMACKIMCRYILQNYSFWSIWSEAEAGHTNKKSPKGDTVCGPDFYRNVGVSFLPLVDMTKSSTLMDDDTYTMGNYEINNIRLPTLLPQTCFDIFYACRPLQVATSAPLFYGKQLADILAQYGTEGGDEGVGTGGGRSDDKGDDEGDNDNEATISSSDPFGLEKLLAKKTETPEHEKVAALSELMQRCFQCIKDLMLHPLSGDFNSPVDPHATPVYYRQIRQPMAFSDIRAHIVNDQYKDDIAAFYRDVYIVFDNTSTYNAVNSAICESAFRLSFVFERLFYEIVLDYHNNLSNNNCCQECRKEVKATDMRNVLCDRCDGVFHLDCLSSKLSVAPKDKEWFCESCLSSRSIGDIHPMRNAIVTHPESGMRGKVVTIKKHHMQLLYIIQFNDGTRSSWSSRQLYKYALPSCLPILAPATNIGERQRQTRNVSGAVAAVSYSNKAGVINNSNNLPAAPRNPLQLPTGYTIENLEAVFLLARGYEGWGWSPLYISPNLREGMSHIAYKKRCTDASFEDFQKSMAVLSGWFSGDYFSGEMSSKEWLTLLRTLMNKVTVSHSLSAYTAKLDENTDALMAHLKEMLQNGEGSRDDFILRPEVKLGDDLVFMNTVDARKKKKDESLLPSLRNKQIGTSTSSTIILDKDGKGRINKNVLKKVLTPKIVEPETDTDDDIMHDSEDEDEENAATATATAAPAAVDASKGHTDTADNTSSTTEAAASSSSTAPTTKPATAATSGENAVCADTNVSADIIDGDTDAVNAAVAEGSDNDTVDGDEAKQPAPSPANTSLVPPRPPATTTTAVAAAAAAAAPAQVTPDPPKLVEVDNYVSMESLVHTKDGYSLRCYSRRRGREEALHQQNVLHAVLTNSTFYTPALDSGVPINQMDPNASFHVKIAAALKSNTDNITTTAGTITSSTSTSNRSYLSKALAPRVDDSVHTQIYLDAWKTNMKNFGRKYKDYVQDELPRCELCGYTEHQLCSPLVYGQTWKEWFNEEYDLTLSELTPHQKKRKDEEKAWLPVDENDATTEQVDAANTDRTLRKGTMITHEYCADRINSLRQKQLYKTLHGNESRMVDVMVGIGRGRSAPIGFDREGRAYWLVPLLDCVFVCHKNNDYKTDKDQSVSASSDNDSSMDVDTPEGTRFSSRLRSSDADGDSDEVWTPITLLPAEATAAEEVAKRCHWQSAHWSVFNGAEGIGRLLNYLNVGHSEERQLKLILCRLYPEVGTVTSASILSKVGVTSDTTTTSTTSTENIDMDKSHESHSTKKNNAHSGIELQQMQQQVIDGTLPVSELKKRICSHVASVHPHLSSALKLDELRKKEEEEEEEERDVGTTATESGMEVEDSEDQDAEKFDSLLDVHNKSHIDLNGDELDDKDDDEADFESDEDSDVWISSEEDDDVQDADGYDDDETASDSDRTMSVDGDDDDDFIPTGRAAKTAKNAKTKKSRKTIVGRCNTIDADSTESEAELEDGGPIKTNKMKQTGTDDSVNDDKRRSNRIKEHDADIDNEKAKTDIECFYQGGKGATPHDEETAKAAGLLSFKPKVGDRVRVVTGSIASPVRGYNDIPVVFSARILEIKQMKTKTGPSEVQQLFYRVTYIGWSDLSKINIKPKSIINEDEVEDNDDTNDASSPSDQKSLQLNSIQKSCLSYNAWVEHRRVYHPKLTKTLCISQCMGITHVQLYTMMYGDYHNKRIHAPELPEQMDEVKEKVQKEEEKEEEEEEEEEEEPSATATAPAPVPVPTTATVPAINEDGGMEVVADDSLQDSPDDDTATTATTTIVKTIRVPKTSASFQTFSQRACNVTTVEQGLRPSVSSLGFQSKYDSNITRTGKGIFADSAQPLPDLLLTLNACQHTRALDRQCMHYQYPQEPGSNEPVRARPYPLQLPDTNTYLGMLKGAMLLVEAALPVGSLEEGEDQWGSDLQPFWRDTVTMATDAATLMGCQILLEHSLRPTWFRAGTLKLLQQLPNRAHAVRNATIGSVAIRVWLYDGALRYGKVASPKDKMKAAQEAAKAAEELAAAEAEMAAQAAKRRPGRKKKADIVTTAAEGN